MKKLFLMAGFALLAASCSNDESLDSSVNLSSEQAAAPVTVRVGEFAVSQSDFSDTDDPQGARATHEQRLLAVTTLSSLLRWHSMPATAQRRTRSRTRKVAWAKARPSKSFVFLATDEQTMNVTIETLDADGNPIFSKTVENVPFKRNRVTKLIGAMYGASATAGSFQVNTTWLDEADPINF